MMFVILCYDIGIKRNTKVKKTVRRFLRPVQKSVCEGFISESKLKKLQMQLKKIINPDEDCVTIYKMDPANSAEKICIGQCGLNEDFIL